MKMIQSIEIITEIAEEELVNFDADKRKEVLEGFFIKEVDENAVINIDVVIVK